MIMLRNVETSQERWENDGTKIGGRGWGISVGHGVRCTAVLHPWAVAAGVVCAGRCAEDREVLAGAVLVYPDFKR